MQTIHHRIFQIPLEPQLNNEQNESGLNLSAPAKTSNILTCTKCYLPQHSGRRFSRFAKIEQWLRPFVRKTGLKIVRPSVMPITVSRKPNISGPVRMNTLSGIAVNARIGFIYCFDFYNIGLTYCFLLFSCPFR